ncbi:MAG TPA: NAD(P)H-dependent oxidoreductase [Quisquiliibacterium sp.]|nr:NAD(P)H-dependent oxidoreductase [Quisquiliibacterium sp.]
MTRAPGTPPVLLIVWWSMTGASMQLAQAAALRASEAAPGEVDVRLLRADQADADDVVAASACLFVMPEMLGAMAGRMKDFFDRSYYGALDRVNGRPYALIVAAGSDGAGAVRQAERIATGWRLKRVVDPLIVCVHAQTPERILAPKVVDEAALARAGEVGATLALGVQMGLW